MPVELLRGYIEDQNRRGKIQHWTVAVVTRENALAGLDNHFRGTDWQSAVGESRQIPPGETTGMARTSRLSCRRRPGD